MFRKGHHRAPRGCKNHLSQLEIDKQDIQTMSKIIEKMTMERMRLEDQVRELRTLLDGEEPTEILSVAQIRAQVRRTAPDVVPVTTPEGSTMLLPVGTNRVRRARHVPSWAVGG